MAEVINWHKKVNPVHLEHNLDKTVRIDEGLIAPAREEIHSDLAPDHAADPIKDMNDIFRISDYLVSTGRFRDNMLFIVGINFGLRASDLRLLRFGNLINDNMTFKDTIAVFEQKTRNTRKRKRNRYITVNHAVREAILLYLQNTDGVSLSDYMFRSQSSGNQGLNNPITVRSINRILERIARDLQLPMHLSSHSLRKTFCYHQMVMSRNDPRKLLLLQKMLGHASSSQTLDYIGITEEEIDEAYKKLNLGSRTRNYLIDSDFFEADEA